MPIRYRSSARSRQASHFTAGSVPVWDSIVFQWLAGKSPPRDELVPSLSGDRNPWRARNCLLKKKSFCLGAETPSWRWRGVIAPGAGSTVWRIAFAPAISARSTLVSSTPMSVPDRALKAAQPARSSGSRRKRESGHWIGGTGLLSAVVRSRDWAPRPAVGPVCPGPAAVDGRHYLLLGFRRDDRLRRRGLLARGRFLQSLFGLLFLFFHFPLSLFVLIVRFQYRAPRWLVL